MQNLSSRSGLVAGMMALVFFAQASGAQSSGVQSSGSQVEGAQDKAKSKIPADTEIKSTASGLKYSILKEGTGEMPTDGDRVHVHYTGWLTDGKEFDSSRAGAPFQFTIGSGVIKGWSEGVKLLKVGSRAKFTIPSDLAYGDRGRGTIPGKATLIFDVELLRCIKMPKYRKPDPKKQKTTKSGLKYEVIRSADGPTFKVGQIFKLDYAIFGNEGKLLECTKMTGRHLTGKIADMRLPFLKEAPPLMQVGSRYLFDVPANLGIPGRNQTTVWELELVAILKPLPVPEFKMSPKDKLKTTASGLQYEVIREGKGSSPKSFNKVKVHYAGWLTDGTLFDSSYGRGDPMIFPLGGVIPGWVEGIGMMKPGGIRRITIPGKLAYGPRGSGKIPPNATLVFYVELISFE